MRRLGLLVVGLWNGALLVSAVWVLSATSAAATPVRITIESFAPATFPTASIVVDIPDINDQVEVSRQAALLTMSPDGWDVGAYSTAWLYHTAPPSWSAELYSVYVENATELPALFGYSLNSEALAYGPNFGLIFHIDAWAERLSHDIGESVNNYGVISGVMGGAWVQLGVQNLGSFSATPIPEPSTALLLGVGLVGMAARRRL